MTDMIRMTGVSKTYPNGKVALEETELQIGEGEILGLIGPNGAGKTTAIKLLMGLLEPTTGQVILWGTESTRLTKQVRGRIGFLLDDRGLYTDLSVEENLHFWARLYAIESKQVEVKLKEWDLWDVRKEPVKQLSSGMSQRLSIAKSILNNPDLLVLDEPTSQLDPIIRASVMDLIVSFGTNNKTVIVTSHDLVGMERVCTRLALLRKGKIATDGSMNEIAGHLGVGKRIDIKFRGSMSNDLLKMISNGYDVQISSADKLVVGGDGASTGTLVRLLVEHGIDVERVEEEKLTLEDLYRTIVTADEAS